MEFRTIDDQPLVVQALGQREVLSTPAEAIADLERIAIEAEAACATAAAQRVELDALRETVKAVRRDASNLRAAPRSRCRYCHAGRREKPGIHCDRLERLLMRLQAQS